MYYIMTDILELNIDILNTIGNYVKKDNERRIKKEEDFKATDFILDRLKQKINLLEKK